MTGKEVNEVFFADAHGGGDLPLLSVQRNAAFEARALINGDIPNRDRLKIHHGGKGRQARRVAAVGEMIVARARRYLAILDRLVDRGYSTKSLKLGV